MDTFSNRIAYFVTFQILNNPTTIWPNFNFQHSSNVVVALEYRKKTHAHCNPDAHSFIVCQHLYINYISRFVFEIKIEVYISKIVSHFHAQIENRLHFAWFSYLYLFYSETSIIHKARNNQISSSISLKWSVTIDRLTGWRIIEVPLYLNAIEKERQTIKPIIPKIILCMDKESSHKIETKTSGKENILECEKMWQKIISNTLDAIPNVRNVSVDFPQKMSSN